MLVQCEVLRAAVRARAVSTVAIEAVISALRDLRKVAIARGLHRGEGHSGLGVAGSRELTRPLGFAARGL